MTGHTNNSKKAMIVIGDKWHYSAADAQGCDIYYYPENITEWELTNEAEHLLEFYAELVWPVYWPPHIRLNMIKKWVLPCERSERETGVAQCNVFCRNYEKGCIKYATK